MLETIIRIVQEAGEIMLAAHAEQQDISSKEGKANFVTKYDVAVQASLQERLQSAFPAAAFWARRAMPEKCCKGGYIYRRPHRRHDKFYPGLPPQLDFRRALPGWKHAIRGCL